MKKLATLFLSAVAALVLCFGLVGCDLFGGGAGGLTREELDGYYLLVSFKDGSTEYKPGDDYNGQEITQHTVTIRLNDAGDIYGKNDQVIKNRMGAQISCSVQDHEYYMGFGVLDFGKKLNFSGKISDTFNSTNGTQSTITGTYNNGTITITYNGITINVNKTTA